MPLDVTLTKLKALWQYKYLHVHYKTVYSLLSWIPLQEEGEIIKKLPYSLSHQEAIDTSSVTLGRKDSRGYFCSKKIIRDDKSTLNLISLNFPGFLL